MASTTSAKYCCPLEFYLAGCVCIIKETCFPSEALRPDVASGGYLGKGTGDLHACNPQAQCYSRALKLGSICSNSNRNAMLPFLGNEIPTERGFFSVG